MYSVVLMLALSGGVDTVGHGRGNGCFGGNGCHGGVAVAGCHGGYGCGGSVVVSHGCNGGWACHGGGGGCHGRRGFLGGLFGGRRGGCHGGHGCNGGWACHGGGGCHGGWACHGGHGCHGGVMIHGGGCHGSVIHGGGCHGGVIDGGGCYGGGVIIPQGGPSGGAPVEPLKNMPKQDKGKMVQGPAPATILVSLPADARLTVDGVATTSTSDRRTLVTPALETGSDYAYTLRAEINRNGETLVQTQQITVRAGQTTQVPFTFTGTGVASR